MMTKLNLRNIQNYYQLLNITFLKKCIKYSKFILKYGFVLFEFCNRCSKLYFHSKMCFV